MARHRHNACYLNVSTSRQSLPYKTRFATVATILRHMLVSLKVLMSICQGSIYLTELPSRRFLQWHVGSHRRILVFSIRLQRDLPGDGSRVPAQCRAGRARVAAPPSSPWRAALTRFCCRRTEAWARPANRQSCLRTRTAPCGVCCCQDRPSSCLP